MTSKLLIWFSIAVIIAVTVLQFIPVNISAEYIVINERFFFGVIDSNNLAIILLGSLLFLFVPLFLLSKNLISLFVNVLILSGILSNLFDRIFRGGVTDYITIKSWPTFNIADVFIVTGIIIYCYQYWQSNIRSKSRKNI